MLTKPERGRSQRCSVVYIRHQGAFEELDAVFKELFSWCALGKVETTGPMVAVYHDEPKDFGVDLAWPRSHPEKCRSWACVQVVGNVPKDVRVKYLEMWPVEIVSVASEGPKAEFNLRSAYHELKAYVTENDFTVSGPIREVFHTYPLEAGQKAIIAVEIQAPVCNLPRNP